MSGCYLERIGVLPIVGLVGLVLGMEHSEVIASAAGSQAAGEIMGENAICGPRCVQFLLARFEKHEKLIDLIDEIQPSSLAEGSTMDALQRAIEKRGLYTAAVDVGPRVRMYWTDPVLVHLREGEDGLGHYMVQLPSTNPREVEVFLGPGNLQTVARKNLALRRSGAVLLVSAKPIEGWEDAFVVVSGAWWWALVPAIVLFSFMWAFRRSFMKKE